MNRSKIEELELQIPEKEGKERILLYNDIAKQYGYSNILQMRNYNNKAQQLSESIGYRRGVAAAHNITAALDIYEGQQTKALELLLRVAEEMREDPFEDQHFVEHAILLNIGYIYAVEQQYDKAITYQLETIRVLEETLQRELSEKDIRYFKTRLAVACNHISEIYQSHKKWDQALPMSQRALALLGELGAKESSEEYMAGLITIGGIYRERGEYERALNILPKLVGEASKPARALRAYVLMIDCAEKLGRWDDLKKYLDAAEAGADKYGDRMLLVQLYRDRIRYLKQIEDYRTVADYYEKYIELKDAIYNENTSKQIAELSGSYELKQKEFEKQQIEKMASLQEQFFTNITHEFRTPLTLILNPSKQISQSTQEAPTRQLADLIYRNSEQLLHLVNQLLDIHKLEANLMQPSYINCDWLAVTQQIIRAFEGQAEEKSVELLFSSDLKRLEAACDKAKVEKILYNLVSNALKFTPPQGKVSIELKTSAKTDRIEFVIEDTGIGISKEDQTHIFDRFYQADSPQAQQGKGTGIGLALVKELVELLGGSIRVRSHLKKGSIFSLSLPLRDLQKIQQQKEKTTRALTTSLKEQPSKLSIEKTEKKKYTVLLVEDNKDMRLYAGGLLTEHYNCIEAENGEEGIKLARKHLPDLIVSDIMMPKKDGIELCQTIKKEILTCHIPVILLTAKSSIQSKLKGLQVGADAYLPKPFHTEELLIRIEQLVKSRSQLREKYIGYIQSNGQDVAQEEAELSMDQQFLKDLFAAIEKHINNENFGVPELSAELRLSRRTLHRKLKALLKESPNSLIRKKRLLRAKELLEKKVVNISEVVYEIGFKDISYFTKCFKQQFKILPSEL